MSSTSPDGEEEGEERSAGFVLFRCSEGQRLYLVLRHRNDGHWAFPKGRIESGEDELTAARREIAEETGIERLTPIPGSRMTHSYRFVRDGRSISKTVVYFLAETDEAQLRLSDEHTDSMWLEPSEARRRLTHAESQRLLDVAEACLDGAERKR